MGTLNETVEARTREMGREIFARAAGDRPTWGSAAWLDEKMMSLTMRDEHLKVQLFRFVDALPALRSDAAINRHLREYLGEAREDLPSVARELMGWLPEDGFTGAIVAKAARFNANRLARRFIAGTDVAETLRTIERLRGKRMGFTVDLLGEAVLSRAEALEYQRQYLHFIDGLTRRAAAWDDIPQIDRDHAGAIPKVNVSVKLSSLFSQFDPIDPEGTSAAVRERLRPILRLARERGAFVNIDMEQKAYKEVTLRIFKEVFDEPEFRDWADVGIAIQAYLRSCEDDLTDLADWAERRGTPVWVRLVKGAYWDYETIVAQQQNWPAPVFTEKAETDANFEAMTRLLIERREALRPAIGSHNVRSVAHTLALCEAHGVPERMVEFQALYGMAEELKTALVGMGQRVRVYTPFGQLLPGMAYLVRRLLENTSNQSFLRAGFLEGVPAERLLMNPLELIRKRTKVTATSGGNGAPTLPPFRNEPLADFSEAPARDAMAVALKQAGSLLGEEAHPAVVGGKRLPAPSWLESINPSHSKQAVGRFARSSEDDAAHAVAAAKDAFGSWRHQPARRRAQLLLDVAKVLRRRRFELAAWEVYECGKPWRESDADVAEAIDFCEFYAREMLRLVPPRVRDVAGEENYMFYEPRGVAAIIAPWNFPLAILCGMTAAAVVTGNTAIMKPAEQSSVVAARLMEAFEEAGAPPGVVNYLPGVGEEIGPTLVKHPDVSLIAFTGSRPVGLMINRQAAEVSDGSEHIKRVIAELGGKNAVIVDEDADLDEAVHGVAASAFGYAGQKCSACSRAIVLESIYDTFVNRLVEVTRSLKIAPAEDPASFVGPVIDAEAQQRILKIVGARHALPSRLVYKADLGDLASEGCYVPPTIFADVPPDAPLAQEEIFGPVLACIRAKDLDDALRIANATRYALTGGLYSRSPRNIEHVKRELRVGNLYINRKITGALVDRQPFGGFKMSGVGSKAGGPDYLQQFMIPRAVTENTLRHGFAPMAEVTAGVAAAGE